MKANRKLNLLCFIAAFINTSLSFSGGGTSSVRAGVKLFQRWFPAQLSQTFELPTFISALLLIIFHVFYFKLLFGGASSDSQIFSSTTTRDAL